MASVAALGPPLLAALALLLFARLFAESARPPRSSSAHGLLAGRDVVLYTFESIGRDHASAGRMPFLDGLLPRAVRSSSHFCLSPTTNNAHIALYASDYTTASGF